jgi:hypothetical protein
MREKFFTTYRMEKLLSYSLSTIFVCILTSCALPDASSGTPADCQSGCGTNGEFWVGVKTPEVTTGENLPRFAAYNTNWGSDQSSVIEADDCSADPDGTNAEKDIFCVIHADELDLAYHGITLMVNAPSDKCEYLGFRPHAYYNSQPGTNSSVVSICKVDGQIVGMMVGTTTVTGSVSMATTNGGCRYAGTPDANSAPVGGVLTYTALQAAAQDLGVWLDGDTPKCIYDYASRFGSNSGAPNCCEGIYRIDIYDWASGETAADADTPTFTTGQNTEWSGHNYSCVQGPGTRVGDKDGGYPLMTIEHVNETNLTHEYKIDRQRSNMITDYDFEMGNYFSSTDQSNQATWGTKISNLFGTGLITPYDTALDPFYTVLCLNRDDEIQARIRVMIRKWNEKPELTDFLADYSNGDPDSGDDYSDPANYEDPPFDDDPINDHRDFDDFNANYATDAPWFGGITLDDRSDAFATRSTRDYYPNIWYSPSGATSALTAFSFPSVLKSLATFPESSSTQLKGGTQNENWSPLLDRRTHSHFRRPHSIRRVKNFSNRWADGVYRK